MRIRPSWKRMKVATWKEWQRGEAYMGVHTAFYPAAGGFRYLNGIQYMAGYVNGYLTDGSGTGVTMADPADVYGPGTHCPELNRVPLPGYGLDYTDRETMARILARNGLLESAGGAAGAGNGSEWAGKGAESARSDRMGPQVRLRLEGGRAAKESTMELLKRRLGIRKKPERVALNIRKQVALDSKKAAG